MKKKTRLSRHIPAFRSAENHKIYVARPAMVIPSSEKKKRTDLYKSIIYEADNGNYFGTPDWNPKDKPLTKAAHGLLEWLDNR